MIIIIGTYTLTIIILAVIKRIKGDGFQLSPYSLLNLSKDRPNSLASLQFNSAHIWCLIHNEQKYLLSVSKLPILPFLWCKVISLLSHPTNSHTGFSFKYLSLIILYSFSSCSFLSDILLMRYERLLVIKLSFVLVLLFCCLETLI